MRRVPVPRLVGDVDQPVAVEVDPGRHLEGAARAVQQAEAHQPSRTRRHQPHLTIAGSVRVRRGVHLDDARSVAPALEDRCATLAGPPREGVQLGPGDRVRSRSAQQDSRAGAGGDDDRSRHGQRQHPPSTARRVRRSRRGHASRVDAQRILPEPRGQPQLRRDPGPHPRGWPLRGLDCTRDAARLDRPDQALALGPAQGTVPEVLPFGRGGDVLTQGQQRHQLRVEMRHRPPPAVGACAADCVGSGS